MVLKPVECPACHGTNVIKHGKSGEGKQRYLCQDQECWVAPQLTVVMLPLPFPVVVSAWVDVLGVWVQPKGAGGP